MRTIGTLVVDAVLVLAFAVIGRASHGSELSLAGIAQTAWPFLIAVIVGSLAADRFGRGSWWRSGLIVWVVTVALGVALRLIGGETAQGAFIVVTALALALLLIGWRGLAALARRRTPGAG